MNGNITRQFTVWCATCSVWQMESEPKMPLFIKRIRANGWRKSKGKWQCPICAMKGG